MSFYINITLLINYKHGSVYTQSFSLNHRSIISGRFNRKVHLVLSLKYFLIRYTSLIDTYFNIKYF